MAYIKDLLSETEGVIEYTVTLIGARHAICEGFKNIVSFSDTEIILRAGKNNVTVIGNALELTKMCSGYICIRGDIISISRNRGEQ